MPITFYALGKKKESDASLAEMLQDDSDGNAYAIAEVYGFRGQTDEALHWRERAYSQKDAYLYIIGRAAL